VVEPFPAGAWVAGLEGEVCGASASVVSWIQLARNAK